MGLFSSLVGLFKASEAPKKEEEVSECCASGQCVCGESSSIEGDYAFSAPIELPNTTSGGPGSALPTVTSGTSTTPSTFDTTDTSSTSDSGIGTSRSTPNTIIDVTSTISTTTGTSSTSDDIDIQELVEEPSEEKKSMQLEFDLSDTVEEKASVPVGTAATSSPPKDSTKNKTQKSKSRRGRKKKK